MLKFKDTRHRIRKKRAELLREGYCVSRPEPYDNQTFCICATKKGLTKIRG